MGNQRPPIQVHVDQFPDKSGTEASGKQAESTVGRFSQLLMTL